MSASQKQCNKCKQVKSVSEFHARPGSKDGLLARCKVCMAESRKAYRENNREKVSEIQRRHDLQRRYNLTPEQWDALMVAQGGVCAICGRKPSGKSRRMHVDHDHSCCPSGSRSCGKCVRGLLCNDCNNLLLGRICQESKKGTDHAREVLRRALTYLDGVAPEDSHTISSAA